MRMREALRLGRDQMRSLTQGKPFARATQDARILFAVSGGGPAWQTAGRQLFAESAAFREQIEAADARIRDDLGFSPVAAYRGDWSPERSEDTRQAHIVNMGLMLLGVCDRLQSMGARPAGALGVSLGEPIAAYISGILTRDEALTLVIALARRVGHEPRDCMRFTLGVDVPTATMLCRRAPAPVDLMGEGARGDALLLCGANHEAAIRAYLEPFDIRGVQPAKGWYHVRDVPFDRDGFVRDVATIEPLRPGLPFYSSAFGGRVHEPVFDSGFWERAGSAAFYFGEAFANAIDDGFDVAIEVGSQMIRGWMETTVERSGAGMRVVSWSAWKAAFAKVPQRPKPPQPTGDGDRAKVRFDPDSESWLISGHAEARAVLGDPHLYSSAPYRSLDPVLLGSDPPEHAQFRAALARHMGPDAMAKVEARAIEAARAHASPPLDAVSEFAAPVAQAAAAALIGFDDETLREIELGSCRASASGGGFPARIALLERLGDRSRLFGQLCDGGLAPEQARTLVRVVWFASTATTERGIARTIHQIVADPALQDKLADAPELMPRLVDELLRLHLPAPIIDREATVASTLAGVAIPAGAALRLDLAAANRDDRVFREPGTLRLDRNRRDSLAFGAGTHACLGAALARRVIPGAVAVLLDGRRLTLAQSQSSRFFLKNETVGPVRLAIEATPR